MISDNIYGRGWAFQIVSLVFESFEYCQQFLVIVKVRFTEPRFTRSYQPKSYKQSRIHRTLVYVWFGLVHLPSHIPYSSLCFTPFLFRFASFRYPSVYYGHICPPPVSSILVYMSYATLPHIYGLLSPFSFSYISSIHRCMYSPVLIINQVRHTLICSHPRPRSVPTISDTYQISFQNTVTNRSKRA